MNIDENIFSKLTDEQKKKVEEAKTPGELLTIAKETGYELSPDQLEAVSGGWSPCSNYCSDYSCPTRCYGYICYEYQP